MTRVTFCLIGLADFRVVAFLSRVFTSQSEPTATQRYRATWNGAVLAESADTFVVEGNHYFPPAAVQQEHLLPSKSRTTCHWKGLASYYDVVVDDKVNRDAAWYYPDPSPAAKRIKDYIAFWRGGRVEQGAA